MKSRAWILAGLLSVGVLSLPSHVWAGSMGNGAAQRMAAARKEKDLNFTDLPKVVQDAVLAASGGSKVRHVTQYIDTANGKLHYHVVVGNGIARQTFALDEAGDLLLTKDKVDFDSLPDPVKEAMSTEAGSGKVWSCVEKASDVKDPSKTYYVGTASQSRMPDKIIRIGEDGKPVSGIPADDIQLTNEKIVPQLNRVIRLEIKTETVKLDDLPGAVKATMAAEMKSDPVDNIVHIMPGANVPEAYVATISKGEIKQRKIFVDGNGDELDSAVELRPFINRYIGG